QATLDGIIADPAYHNLFTLVKGFRNGIVYGTKVRFPHALVMIFLFRHGTFRHKLHLVLQATRHHARNLGFFCITYKTSMYILRVLSPTGKEGHYDSFVAGLVGGYLVFGRGIHSSVNQQIVIYVFARVVLAVAKLLVQRPDEGRRRGGGGGWGLIRDEALRRKVEGSAWTVFATVSWAAVMYLFRWHPETIQPSLRSSMHYIYEDCEKFSDLRTLLWRNK
ncbi:Tim17/Tim22/Tim23/Pmp24 family-domain-containing protein, partial [Lineolata rhizophorae]